jgi:hypothetical protein
MVSRRQQLVAPVLVRSIHFGLGDILFFLAFGREAVMDEQQRNPCLGLVVLEVEMRNKENKWFFWR